MRHILKTFTTNKNVFFLFLLLASGLISGCGTFDSIFGTGGNDVDAKPRLKGERISIIELQTKLEPLEDPSANIYTLPEAWSNEFWPQQGGYPNHAMHNPALGNSPLGKLWKTSIGEGSTRRLPLSTLPIILDDKIYVLNTRSELIAFALEDGEEVWSADISNEEEGDTVIGGGIAGSRGKIFATNGYNEVISLDAASGEIDWRVELPAAVRAAPSVLSGRVFVQTLANQVIALAASDGNLLWTHQAVGETSGLLGSPAPAVNRDIVIPGYSSGEIYALHLENGGVAWQDNLSPQQRLGGIESLSDIQAMPVIDRGLVIAISFGGRLVAIDQRTGRRVWQREIGGSETPWVAGERIFVLSSQNRLVSFDRESGNIMWVKDMPKFEAGSNGEEPLVLYGPVMAGGRLFISASDATIFEIDPHNGDDLFHWDAGEDLVGPPIIAQNKLYLLSSNGYLMAFD